MEMLGRGEGKSLNSLLQQYLTSFPFYFQLRGTWYSLLLRSCGPCVYRVARQPDRADVGVARDSWWFEDHQRFQITDQR